MSRAAGETLYMLDTNILVSWASTLTSVHPERDGFAGAAAGRIKRFCEENRNTIVVPDIVWVEFLSVMLHKAIDVNDDLETTLRRFRDRQTLVQQIEARIREADNWRLDWEPDTSPFADAQELLQDTSLIDRKIYDWLRRSAENRRKKYQPDMDRLTNKILDGMDSAILICLNELASQKENAARRVVLFTADFPLWRVLNRVKEIHRKWFAPNTHAVFALFPEIICRYRIRGKTCGHGNAVSVLTTQEMICGAVKGKDRHPIRF